MRQRFALNVSVFVIVRRAHEVLMLRRAGTGWKDGCYSLPAGGHDGGESLAEAAARELREETSLLAAPADMTLQHLMHCQAGDTGGEWLGAFFLAERWTGEPRLMEPERHDWIGWHPLDALPANTIPYTRQGIALACQQQTFSTHGWPGED